MKMEDYNINAELDLMKEQMRELKQIVESKDLVNRDLMRQIMAYKAKWIQRLNKIQIFVILPLIFLGFLFLQHLIGLSWLFYWVTVVGCCISVCIDVYINRLSDKDYYSMPLLDLMTRLVKRQKYRRIQFAVGIFVVALWCVWYIMEIRAAESTSDFSGLWISGAIGGIIGGIVAYLINDKAQQIDAAAVRDIRKMMGE